jgi:hypothetical protein
MATTALISVTEYLATSYRPDCDYLVGEVLKRNLGEREYSWLQGRFIRYLAEYELVLGFFASRNSR